MGPAPSGWLASVAQLAPEDAVYAEFFSRHESLRNAEAVDLLHEEVLRVLYDDPKRAERLARAACRLAADLDDPAPRAAALRAMGHVSYAGARYDEAIQYYCEALEVLAQLDRDLDKGRTLTSGIQSLIYLGRYDEAFAWAARAREIFERCGDHLRVARVVSNVANILYRQDRYAEALAMYEEALDTFRDIGGPRDMAAVLSNIAVCQISLSKFSQALASYEKARDYCTRNGMPRLVAEADYNIAYLHYLQGDFLRAIEMYKASREHCRAAGDAYHAALCDLDEAELHLELNLNAEAAGLAQLAETAFGALGIPYERAKALVTHAIAASRRAETAVARRSFERARRLFAAERNSLWPALIDLYRAMLLDRENCVPEADRLCRRARRTLAESALSGPATLAELLQCRLLLKTGDIAGAREMCGLAHARLAEAGTPSLRFHVSFVQGMVEERSGNDAAAFDAYESARREIETLRSRLWGDEPKISFLKDKLEVYESLVALRLAHRTTLAGSVAAAFQYIQQAKSRSLADLISQPSPAGSEGGSHCGEESEIAETRGSLNAQYRQMERLALAGGTAAGAQLEAVRQSVRDHETRLLRLAAAARPRGAARPDAPSIAADAIQAAIPAGARHLEYYAVKGVLWVCITGRSSLEMISLGGVEEIRARMRLLRFQMRRFHLERRGRPMGGEPLDAPTGTHLRELYDDLIQPLRDHLGSARHLIISPHEFLHHLPFHALRSPDGFLIDEYTVSYAPSATVFALCAARRDGFGAQSLVLALPDPLAPHIDVEAKAAAELLPESRLFLGEQATQEVLRRLGPASRFIHIATHGLFRRDNPLFSNIRLGDSHLTLLDLYHLPLSAELVTLSGCSTGLNAVVAGDELLGLTRGLLLAGAHGVMVSLWDVNDLSTTKFMQGFYRELHRAPDKAMALRRAMREVRAECPHPYYWAPFVIAGKYDSVKK